LSQSRLHRSHAPLHLGDSRPLAACLRGRAVELDNPDVGRGKETGHRIQEVHPRVVQTAQGRPLLAQHVRVVPGLDGQVGQLLQGHGPDAFVAQAKVGVVERAELEREGGVLDGEFGGG